MAEIKNEIALRAISDNDYILNRNGADMVCPFIPVVMMKQNSPAPAVGQLQQPPIVVPTRTGCSTMCPMFELKSEIDGTLTARLGCGSGNISRSITKIISLTEQTKASDRIPAGNDGMKVVN